MSRQLTVDFFLEKHVARTVGSHKPKQSHAARDGRARRPTSWPGNIRELENEIQRDAVMSQGVIEVTDLSPKIQAGG